MTTLKAKYLTLTYFWIKCKHFMFTCHGRSRLSVTYCTDDAKIGWWIMKQRMEELTAWECGKWKIFIQYCKAFAISDSLVRMHIKSQWYKSSFAALRMYDEHNKLTMKKSLANDENIPLSVWKMFFSCSMKQKPDAREKWRKRRKNNWNRI